MITCLKKRKAKCLYRTANKCRTETEAAQFLLQHQLRHVLTERFCQDVIENYFGREDSLGALKDNPSLRNFGYNDNSI